MPDSFWQGIKQFNQGEYYACHDTLESLWLVASEPPKSLYQGILQISVACYHLGNQNWLGAVTLLGEGIRRLSDYEPTYAQLDIAAFVTESFELLDQLHEAGATQVKQFSSLNQQGLMLRFVPPIMDV